MDITDYLIAWLKWVAIGNHTQGLGGVIDKRYIGRRGFQQFCPVFVQPGQDIEVPWQCSRTAYSHSLGEFPDSRCRTPIKGRN